MLTSRQLFGYDQGVFGGVIVTDDFLQTLNLVGKTGLIGTVTALYDIGCFFGALVAFIIGDWQAVTGLFTLVSMANIE